ncbi:hypothetical protein J4H86_01160 [Spiractinospora alimapuensis]|uniref:hypothetical protein n=1 Tax=Spiractinospora alimapuensis TaxID=2820884 RepID=UPI001F3976B0|nr:hypothetical protein [Spiractinospora alimapuensis]QVQ52497.1 hypothetical protein J4H86_01160 [Spiractinospora alimapuensis]
MARGVYVHGCDTGRETRGVAFPIGSVGAGLIIGGAWVASVVPFGASLAAA